MIMPKLLAAATVLLVIFSMVETVFAQQKPVASLLNINDFYIWTRYDGLAGRNPLTDQRTRFPRDAAGALFQEGLIWGGYVNETGTPELRVGGFAYLTQTNTTAGAIVAPGVAEDPADAGVRVYRIRKDLPPPICAGTPPIFSTSRSTR